MSLKSIYDLIQKESNFLDNYFENIKDDFYNLETLNDQLCLFKNNKNSYDAEIEVGELIENSLLVEVDEEEKLIYILYKNRVEDVKIVKSLPDNSNLNNIKASYKDGFLKISIPKNVVKA